VYIVDIIIICICGNCNKAYKRRGNDEKKFILWLLVYTAGSVLSVLHQPASTGVVLYTEKKVLRRGALI
jgi:hypothetical protein